MASSWHFSKLHYIGDEQVLKSTYEGCINFCEYTSGGLMLDKRRVFSLNISLTIPAYIIILYWRRQERPIIFQRPDGISRWIATLMVCYKFYDLSYSLVAMFVNELLRIQIINSQFFEG